MNQNEEDTKRKLRMVNIKLLIYLKAAAQGIDPLSVAEELLEESNRRNKLAQEQEQKDMNASEQS